MNALSAPVPQGGDLAGLVSGDTAFAMRVLDQAYRGQPGANILLSPYSLSTVLQMVANGAAGETRTEMQQVLGTARLSEEAVNRGELELRQGLVSAGSNVVLTTANAIWHRPGAELKPQFVAINTQYFGATLSPLDFTSPRAAGIVNAWAEEQTAGRIKQVLSPPLPGNTEVLLANAIYFKGDWLKKFDAKETSDEPFYLHDSGQRRLPMMRQKGEFEYLADDLFQAIRLPYAGGRLGLCVVLPATNQTPAKIIAKLDAPFLRDHVLGRLRETPGTIALPRFKLEFDIELRDLLIALGMKRAFSDADFSRMSSAPLVLSRVKQKCFMEVNEEGTEAAAVTVATMKRLAVERPRPPFEMVVNRPFLFVLYDNVTRGLLFTGVVFDPKSS